MSVMTQIECQMTTDFCASFATQDGPTPEMKKIKY